jgi:dsDNA-binding SOS-regulon protein
MRQGDRHMHRIVQANIDKFKKLLETETDPTKRAVLLRLLAAEEEQKRELAMSPNAKKAF